MSNSGSTRGCLAHAATLSLSGFGAKRGRSQGGGKEGGEWVGKRCLAVVWEIGRKEACLRWMPLGGLGTAFSGIQCPLRGSFTVHEEPALSFRAGRALRPAGTSAE